MPMRNVADKGIVTTVQGTANVGKAISEETVERQSASTIAAGKVNVLV
jgi:hypothetical protein